MAAAGCTHRRRPFAVGGVWSDPPPRVVVAHALRITDLAHVVDRNPERGGKPLRATFAHHPPGPFAVVRHQHHRHIGDRGARFDIRLDAVMGAHPLRQMRRVGGSHPARAQCPAAADLVQEAHPATSSPDPGNPVSPPSMVPRPEPPRRPASESEARPQPALRNSSAAAAEDISMEDGGYHRCSDTPDRPHDRVCDTARSIEPPPCDTPHPAKCKDG